MNMSDTTTTAHETKKLDYESNPFKVTFKGLDWLFRYNQPIAIVLLIFGFFSNFRFYDLGGGPSDETTTVGGGLESLEPAAIIFGIVLIISILGFLLLAGSFIAGFISYAALKTSYHQKVTFTEAAQATMNKIWTIVGIDINIAARVFLGIIFFVIPGIRAALRYQFALMAMFDEDLGVKQSLKKSKALTKKRLIEVFGMLTAANIVPFIGQPLQVGGQAVMFKQLTQLRKHPHEKPPIHWLNYLGIFLFIALVVVIIVAVVVATNT